MSDFIKKSDQGKAVPQPSASEPFKFGPSVSFGNGNLQQQGDPTWVKLQRAEREANNLSAALITANKREQQGIARHAQQVADLNDQITQLQSTTAQLQGTVAQHQDTVARLQTTTEQPDADVLMSDYHDRGVQLEADNEELKKEIKRLKDDLSKQNKAVFNQAHEIKLKTDELSHSTRDNAQLKDLYNEFRSKYEEEASSHRSAVDHLTNAYADLNTTRAQLSSAQHANQNAEEMYQQKLLELSSLHSEWELSQQKIVELESKQSQIQHVEQAYHNLVEEVEPMRAHNNDMDRAAKVKDARIQYLEMQLQQALQSRLRDEEAVEERDVEELADAPPVPVHFTADESLAAELEGNSDFDDDDSLRSLFEDDGTFMDFSMVETVIDIQPKPAMAVPYTSTAIQTDAAPYMSIDVQTIAAPSASSGVQTNLTAPSASIGIQTDITAPVASTASQTEEAAAAPYASTIVQTDAAPYVSVAAQTIAAPSTSTGIQTDSAPCVSIAAQTITAPSASTATQTVTARCVSTAIQTDAAPSDSIPAQPAAAPHVSTAVQTDAAPGVSTAAQTIAAPSASTAVQTDAVTTSSKSHRSPGLFSNWLFTTILFLVAIFVVREFQYSLGGLGSCQHHFRGPFGAGRYLLGYLPIGFQWGDGWMAEAVARATATLLIGFDGWVAVDPAPLL